MDSIIGKKAYKKGGFFSGLVGTVVESNNGITPYIIDVKDVATIPFMNIEDIVLVDEQQDRMQKVKDSYNKIVARNGDALRRLGEE